MNKTLIKIIRYASLAMAIIAGYSMAVSLIIYKFNFAAMPLHENLIMLNDLLMLAVGIMGVRLCAMAGSTPWFVKLSLVQAIASVLCVAAVYLPNKMWSVSLFDIIYILSAMLSVAVLVSCIMAGMDRKAEHDGEV